MIRGKRGEGLRSVHRNAIPLTTVKRGNLSSPRMLSDLEANLEDLLLPIRDRIGSSRPVRPGKVTGEATMAIRRERGTKRSTVDLRQVTVG
jgi:hypothetical protein